MEWVRDLALNPDHQDIKVTLIHCTELDQKTGKTKIVDFITDLNVTKHNVLECVQLGRSRWKIENETFNTLKNQGYHFEHNFGHGKHHLASNFAQLMMLAFLFDQIQQHTDTDFKMALLKTKTKKKLWQQVRAIFTWIPVSSMQTILQLIANKQQVKIQYLI